MSFRVQNKISYIFGELSAARKLSGKDYVFLNFLQPKFSAKNPDQSVLSYTNMPLKNSETI